MAYPAITIAPVRPVYDDKGLGRHMRKLSPKQRAFVLAYVSLGGQNATAAAKASGYGTTPESQRVAAYRLTHDDKVLAAIREEADKTIRSSILLGTQALIEIAETAHHKDRFKAAVELINRGGLLVTTQHNVNVNVNDSRTDKEVVANIERMAKQLGLDPGKLLGQALGVQALPAPVDAEFVVVDDGVETDEDPLAGMADGSEGLENILG